MLPYLELTFIGTEKSVREKLRKSIIHKEERSAHGRSLDINKKDSKKLLQIELLSDCIAKIKRYLCVDGRTVVADNISMPTFTLADSKATKNYILTTGASLVYEQPKENNTHGFMRTLIQRNPDFLESDFNQLMKMKLKDSFIMPKKSMKVIGNKGVEFEGDYESANL